MVLQIHQRRAMHHKEELYSIERFKTCLAIRLTDRVDSLNFGEVLDELAELLKSERTVRVVLDMRTVDMLQSVALGHVVQFEKAIRDNGGTFRLCNVQPMIANVLEVTKLNTLVEVADCEESAIRDWGSQGDRQNRKSVRARRGRQRDSRKQRRRPANNKVVTDRTTGASAERAVPPIVEDDEPTPAASRPPAAATPAEPSAQHATDSASVTTSSKPGILQTIYNLGWIGLHTKLGLAAVAGLAIFAGYLLFGTGPNTASSYRLCVATYQEVSTLRDAKADASRWNNLQQQSQDRMTPHITKLSRLGSGRSELQSELLAAFKSLATVIEDDRNTPGNADAEVQRHLANAKTLLE